MATKRFETGSFMKNLKVKYAISSMENLLPQSLFLRIHRSFIVSEKKVTAFSSHDVEIGKMELPIDESYFEVIGILAGNAKMLPHNDNL